MWDVPVRKLKERVEALEAVVFPKPAPSGRFVECECEGRTCLACPDRVYRWAEVGEGDVVTYTPRCRIWLKDAGHSGEGVP